MDEALRRRVLARVAWRLLPFLFLLYIVNILDRVNVGFAKLRMLDDLGLGEDVYGFGSGIFYIGYLTFEVPSNLILRRVGARRWIARIMITWGLITCGMMLVQGKWGFYLLRILLGVAEAGFFPGIILYLTYWFPARERARAVAFFMAASPLAGILGSPLSGAILQYLNGLAGLRGWQWLFVLEGMPAIVLGFGVLRYLTDRPEEADWLTSEERTGLATEIGAEEKQVAPHHGRTLLEAVRHPRVWLLILLYFTVAAGSNTFGFFLPTLVKSRFAGATDFEVGVLSAIPHVCAMIGMIVNGMHSDRTGERRWHVAVPSFLAALGWEWYVGFDGPVASLLALALVQLGIMSMLPTFWTLPPSFLRGVAAAGGIALINSVGNLGGFAGPSVVGWLRERSGDFNSGLLVMAATMAVGGLLALCVRQERIGPVA